MEIENEANELSEEIENEIDELLKEMENEIKSLKEIENEADELLKKIEENPDYVFDTLCDSIKTYLSEGKDIKKYIQPIILEIIEEKKNLHMKL